MSVGVGTGVQTGHSPLQVRPALALSSAMQQDCLPQDKILLTPMGMGKRNLESALAMPLTRSGCKQLGPELSPGVKGITDGQLGKTTLATRNGYEAFRWNNTVGQGLVLATKQCSIPSKLSPAGLPVCCYSQCQKIRGKNVGNRTCTFKCTFLNESMCKSVRKAQNLIHTLKASVSKNDHCLQLASLSLLTSLDHAQMKSISERARFLLKPPIFSFSGLCVAVVLREYSCCW